MPKRTFERMGLGKTDFINLSKSMISLDFQKELKCINSPVMVFCGEKDSANKHASLQLQSQLPQAELLVIKNSGHEVNIDAPEDLGKALSAFFNL